MSTIFHIGLPKTASTFLQKRVFPKLSNYDFQTSHDHSLENRFSWVYEVNQPFHDVTIPRALRREMIRERFGAPVNPRHQVQPISDADKDTLVSSEGFAGVSYDPLINADLIANRLSAENEGARVIVCLRRQDDWCESIYKQLVFNEDRFGRYIPFEKYAGLRYDSESVMFCGDLKWDQLVEHYFSRFGKNNVCVLFFEELTQDPATFMSRLMQFLGVADNLQINTQQRDNVQQKSVKYEPCSAGEKVRRLAAAAIGPRERLRFEARTLVTYATTKIRRRPFWFEGMDVETRRLIMDLVADSNDNLSRFVDQDIGLYGYV